MILLVYYINLAPHGISFVTAVSTCASVNHSTQQICKFCVTEKLRNFQEVRNHQEIVEKLLRNYQAAGNYWEDFKNLLRNLENEKKLGNFPEISRETAQNGPP